MTEQEALERMKAKVLFLEGGEDLVDNATGHVEADSIVLEFLKSNFPELGAYYERASRHFWYE